MTQPNITSAPNKNQRLLQLAQQKGYNIFNNADGTISLQFKLSKRFTGRWNDAYGAIRWLEKQDNYYPKHKSFH